MGLMGYLDKAKGFADTAFEKTGELSEHAREKAPEYIDKAADLAVKVVEATTHGIDKVTGGRFHDKLENAATKVEEALEHPHPHSPGSGTATTGAVVPEPSTGTPPTPPPATPPSTPMPSGESGTGTPITPSATNPDATDPDTSRP